MNQKDTFQVVCTAYSWVTFFNEFKWNEFQVKPHATSSEKKYGTANIPGAMRESVQRYRYWVMMCNGVKQ